MKMTNESLVIMKCNDINISSNENIMNNNSSNEIIIIILMINNIII